jgi:hypothetical protein
MGIFTQHVLCQFTILRTLVLTNDNNNKMLCNIIIINNKIYTMIFLVVGAIHTVG